MKLYLVQHGKAVPKEEDPDRPLTEEGLLEIKKMADWIAERGHIKVHAVSHSGKTRARETAGILTQKLQPPRGCFKVNDLEPKADPHVWRDRANLMDHDLMIIGHLPHLAKLASLLLTGTEDQSPVTFTHGGIICLQKDDSANWSIAWVETPETV